MFSFKVKGSTRLALFGDVYLYKSTLNRYHASVPVLQIKGTFEDILFSCPLPFVTIPLSSVRFRNSSYSALCAVNFEAKTQLTSLKNVVEALLSKTYCYYLHNDNG